MITAGKVSRHAVFSGPYFPIFGLNTEIYSVNLCIQSEYRKIRTRTTPHLDTFHAVDNDDQNKSSSFGPPLFNTLFSLVHTHSEL